MIKIILYITFVFVMLSLLPSCNSIQPTNHSIKEQNTPSITKQNNDSVKEPIQESTSFLSIHMVNERVGWAFNKDRLFHTSDGGECWDDITPDIGNLVKAGIEGYFYDENTGWVVVQEDGLTVANHNIKSTTIFYTSNGGKEWKRSIIPSYNLGTDMSFIDSNKAWLLLFQDSSLGIQKVEIYKTNNQGKSWVKISDAEKENRLSLGGQKAGISFINDNEGCIVRNTNLGASLISRTDDGGKTWREQLNLCEELGMDSSLQALKPVFLNKSDGIIPVSLYKSEKGNYDNIFYYTLDGGKNWGKSMPIQSTERIEQQDYCFINLRVGWLITSEGILYNTKDGGANWINIWENTDYENIRCLNFVSEQIGWALADNKIIKTVDGGCSWKEIVKTSNVSYTPTSSEQLKSILIKKDNIQSF